MDLSMTAMPYTFGIWFQLVYASDSTSENPATYDYILQLETNSIVFSCPLSYRTPFFCF